MEWNRTNHAGVALFGENTQGEVCSVAVYYLAFIVLINPNSNSKKAAHLGQSVYAEQNKKTPSAIVIQMFGYCIGSNEYVVMKMEIFFH